MLIEMRNLNLSVSFEGCIPCLITCYVGFNFAFERIMVQTQKEIGYGNANCCSILLGRKKM